MLGTGDGVNTKFLEKVVKIMLTREEEIKLKDYNGDISKLGPAERCLKAIVDIPFAFKRFDAMLFRATFEEEINFIKKSFTILEVSLPSFLPRYSSFFMQQSELIT